MVELDEEQEYYEDVAKYQHVEKEYEDIPDHQDNIPPPLPTKAVKSSSPSQAALAIQPPQPQAPPASQPPQPQPPPPSQPQATSTPASQPPPSSQSAVQGSEGDHEYTKCIAYQPTNDTVAIPTTTPTDIEIVYSD